MCRSSWDLPRRCNLAGCGAADYQVLDQNHNCTGGQTWDSHFYLAEVYHTNAVVQLALHLEGGIPFMNCILLAPVRGQGEYVIIDKDVLKEAVPMLLNVLVLLNPVWLGWDQIQ